MKPIPKSILVNTGNEAIVARTIDDFFLETKKFAQSTYGLQELLFQIRSGEIAYDPLRVADREITDDRITYLSYNSIILASVFAIRTDFNYVRYTFFRDLDGVAELLSKKI